MAGGVALAQGDASPDKKELLQQKVAAIKESIAQNQASLRQYTWTAHTKISVKAEVKNEKDELCKYGPDGKVVKTLARKLRRSNQQTPSRQPRSKRLWQL